MDIAGPRPEEEVSPKPWVAARRRLDLRAVIRGYLQDHPEATVDQVRGHLAQHHRQVPALLVAGELLRFRRGPAKK